MPLYISLLYKVMKSKGIHEGCLEQMDRLFRTKLYAGGDAIADGENRIRMDDWELRDDVQSEVNKLWQTVDSGNVASQADVEGYRNDFLRLFGFNIEGVDYSRVVSDALI